MSDTERRLLTANSHLPLADLDPVRVGAAISEACQGLEMFLASQGVDVDWESFAISCATGNPEDDNLPPTVFGVEVSAEVMSRG